MPRCLHFLLLLASAAAFMAPAPLSKTFSTTLAAKKIIRPKIAYAPCIAIKDLPKPGSATSGVAGGLAICIAVDKGGQIYALGDKCPPVNQPLSFGRVADGCIEDPVLGTKFNLRTGQVVNWCPSGLGKLLGGLFEPSPVPTFPVRKQGSNIMVQVDVNAKVAFESNYWTGVLDAQGKSDGTYY